MNDSAHLTGPVRCKRPRLAFRPRAGYHGGMAQQNFSDPAKYIELQQRLDRMRIEHREKLRASHLELVRQEAEIRALEFEVEAAESDIGLIAVKAKPFPRPNGVGPKTKSKHPFPHAVGNVRAWAQANHLSYGNVKAWFAPPTAKHRMAIPRVWQQRIERAYGVPERAWKNGVTDSPLAGRRYKKPQAE